MSHILRPCNGLAKCFRHPTGCAKIVTSPHEDWEMRQKRKARRRRLWNTVLESYQIQAKWGLDPIPRQYHLKAVLLLEKLLDEEELWQRITARQEKEILRGASH